MLITRHAQARFAQRIDASASPIKTLLLLWENGEDVTGADLSMFNIQQEAGGAYRRAKYNGLTLVMISKNDALLTVYTERKGYSWGLAWGKRTEWGKPPRPKRQKRKSVR